MSQQLLFLFQNANKSMDNNNSNKVEGLVSGEKMSCYD